MSDKYIVLTSLPSLVITVFDTEIMCTKILYDLKGKVLVQVLLVKEELVKNNKIL